MENIARSSICFSRQVVDFPASLEKGSFSVKSCVSVELDELRRRLHGLPDLLQVVAEEEKERLPKEVGACVVSYIPHVGYLVAMPIKRALQEQGFDYHNIPGYHFMFENNGAAHYKNECTDSLDEKLGDVVLDITRTEMAIMAQVSNEVLQAGTCLDKAIRRVLRLLLQFETNSCYSIAFPKWPSLHYRLSSIEGVPFRFANFASHFISVQIFQLDFPLILSAHKYFR